MSDEGRLIADRYRLHQQIGSGAMGVVWRAVDERLNRTVAVKQLLLQPGYTPEETEEARQRSMREGRIAARLQHQNAIVIFDVAEDEGQPVLVMEYLFSRSLASVLTDQGLLAPVRVAQIGAQVAGALAAAHMAGIVHRDLKPGNILLGDNGLAKITDFGISRAIGDVSVTKSGILAGTPAYLSPEVALGRDPAPASDVFSLGSTLYSAIEGEPPFGVDENAISLLHRVARGEVTPPRQAGPMASALMHLLQPDPVDRPTMAQAKELLQSVADGRPVPTAGPSQRHQPTPPPQRSTRSAAPPPAAAPNPAPATRTTASVQPQQRRDTKQTALLWTMAVLIAVLAGILVATVYSGNLPRSSGQPGSAQTTRSEQSAAESSRIPSPSEPAPTTPVSSETASQQDPARVVADYYSLVPENTDQAWTMLGPGLTAQGKENYAGFWDTIEDVRITGGPAANGEYVTVSLLYTKADGTTSSEEHVLHMVRDANGTPLINGEVG